MATVDQQLLATDPSSRPSPQGETMDYLVWDRLSAFWKTSFAEEDRQALNAIYEAAAGVLDAEMVRLAEINAAKGVFSCPIYTQRRWVRLDLNRYKELKAFLSYVTTGELSGVGAGCGAASTSTDPNDDSSRYLPCSALETSHAAH